MSVLRIGAAFLALVAVFSPAASAAERQKSVPSRSSDLSAVLADKDEGIPPYFVFQFRADGHPVP